MPTPIQPLFGSSGPLSALETNPYGYKELKYPLDLGDGSRYPYQMKFYINVAEKSSYKNKPDFVSTSQPPTNVRPVSTDLQPNNYTKLFRRTTFRTQQAISLYMPDTLNWSFGQSFKDFNMTEEWGKAGMVVEGIKQLGNLTYAAGSAISSLVKGDDDILKKARTESLKSLGIGGGLAGETLAALLKKDPTLGTALVGLAQNPNVEVLYQQPTLRTFQFEFVFAPRNENEAKTAISIIQLFKFHAAPENFANETGRYFVPPSDFDIQFHGPQGEIWQLGKIIPNSVLRNITVNYGQSGQFAMLPGDYPTNIQLMLEFQETHFITKGLVEDGY